MGTKHEDEAEIDVRAAQSVEFFRGFRADELGSTKIIVANPTQGRRGLKQKMLDLTKPDCQAAPMIISLRAEYFTDEPTVSPEPSAPQPIADATNAAPIVITTPADHGLLTGAVVTITGVRGNTAANGVFTITVLSPTTFELNGSVGNGAYLGGGEYVFLTGLGTLGGTPAGTSGVGGPLVGRLEWGVGGGHNIIEFDIPTARFTNFLRPLGFPDSQPVDDIGNGTQLYINASHVSLYARHDGNISTVNSPGTNRVNGGTTPAKIITFISPGASRGGSPLQRTIHAAGGLGPNVPLAAGANVIITIPTFARRAWFQRIPSDTTPLLVRVLNNVDGTMYEARIPINSEGPMILRGDPMSLNITNQGAVALTELQVLFEVSPI